MSKVLESFYEFLRIPSISASPAHADSMKDCAEWLRAKFVSIGFSAEVHPLPGPPVVLARSPFSPLKKTLLIYGHYDVQPVDPRASWRNDPFEPVVENGLILARGATDNKGQTYCHLAGTEAWLRERGELPVNLIYLMEGEEEIGSPHLGAFLEAHRAELACDAVMISDTSMVGPGFPAITCGLRGIACLELHVHGPEMDLHSGMFGGTIANPALELAKLLTQMHAADGSIAIPGFYDDVLPVADAERATWRDLPYGEREILAATGAPMLTGEAEYGPLERIWIRPTAEINGLTSGYQGEGSKTIVPRSASAKLSFRLVPGQEPDRIAEVVREFFESKTTPGVTVKVTYDHGGNPCYLNPRTEFGEAAQAALTEVFGRSPALVREGLSIPIVNLFQRVLGRDALLIGLGLPDCQAHAPNESFPVEQLEKGIAFHQAFLAKL